MQPGSMETDAAVPALPDDVLAAILGRLLARSLAASRCVCKAWRDLVDERGLLERIRHLLPHSVSGMFINYVDPGKPHFFARPTSSVAAAFPVVDGKFSYVLPERLDYAWYKVADHCNGLVLYRNEDHGADLYVCNPMTRRWVRLPRLAVRAVSQRRVFLVFKPAASRHYQVLVAPLELVPEEEQRQDHPLQEQDAPPAGDTEWPPSRWTWHVFSSRSGQWRERVFVREGEAAGIVADLRMDSLRYSPNPRWRYAVQRKGALYVHCRGEYVSRLSLSAGEYSYHVIKSPIDRSECYKKMQSFLGRSEGEVYFVAINRRRFRVWMLKDHESQQHDPTAGSGWILKHDRVLRPNDWRDVVVHGCYQQIQREGPWILDDYYNHRKDRRKLDWSSDGEDDIICSNADGDEEGNDDEEHYVYPKTFDFVGFHPYKEVIFLETLDVVVAYHLSTSKVQFLGILTPAEWNYGLYDSFVYTPCQDLRHRG